MNPFNPQEVLQLMYKVFEPKASVKNINLVFATKANLAMPQEISEQGAASMAVRDLLKN